LLLRSNVYIHSEARETLQSRFVRLSQKCEILELGEDL